MRRIIYLLLFPFLLLQCKTQDYLTPYDYDGRVLEFGSGGGFTGQSMQYCLMDNGQIFKGTNKEGNVSAVKKIAKDEVKQIFDNYDSFGFNELDLESPGNMYYFLIMKDDVTTHKITWGDRDANEPKELRVFHAILLNLVNVKMVQPNEKIKVK